MSVGSKDLGLFPGDGGGSAFGCPWGGAGGGIFHAMGENGGFLTAPCGRFPAALNGLFDERRQQMELTRKRYKRGVQPC